MKTQMELFKPNMISTDDVVVNLDIDAYFYLRSLEERIIELDDAIDSETIAIPLRSIIQINKMDQGIPVEDRVPIKLLLTSDGGDVIAGLSLIDAIQNSTTPVYTINMSHQYSMGALIGLVGHKRFATKSASYLIHDGGVSIQDSSGRVHDFIKFELMLQKRLKDIVLGRTEISAKMYNKKAREEWYFFADEAKKLGVVDSIIGEDVTLEEIL